MSYKILVENINVPGRTSRVDKTKYLAMKKVLMSLLPVDESGITQIETLSLIQLFTTRYFS